MNILYPLSVILQVILYIAIAYFTLRSFRTDRLKHRKDKWVIASDTVVSLLMLLCFAAGQEPYSPFHNEPYYIYFMILSLSMLSNFWLMKFGFDEDKPTLYFFQRAWLGSFFIVAGIIVAKLNILILFAWFPLLGVLVITPSFVSLVVLAEIIRQSDFKLTGTLTTILSGGLMLFILEVILNLILTDNWILWELLRPDVCDVWI